MRFSRAALATVTVLGFGLAGLAIVASPSPFFRVGSGEVGVLYRNGEAIRTVGPGLGVKLPFLDSVQRMATRTQRFTFPRLSGKTSDGQTVEARITVIYRLDAARAAELQARFSWDLVGEAIGPAMAAAYRTLLGELTSSELYVATVDARLLSLLKAQIPNGIGIDQLLVEETTFDPAFVEIEKRRRYQRLEAEIGKAAQIAEAEARLQADLMRFNALAAEVGKNATILDVMKADKAAPPPIAPLVRPTAKSDDATKDGAAKSVR